MGKTGSKGVVAFAAGAVAAPALGAAAGVVVVGLAVAGWLVASSGAPEADEGEEAFAFADPEDFEVKADGPTARRRPAPRIDPERAPRAPEGRPAEADRAPPGGDRTEGPAPAEPGERRGPSPRSTEADRPEAAPATPPPETARPATTPPETARPDTTPPDTTPHEPPHATRSGEPAPPRVDDAEGPAPEEAAVDPVARAAQRAEAEREAPAAPVPSPPPPPPEEETWGDTLRYFVDRGVALLTGGSPPEEAPPATALAPRQPPPPVEMEPLPVDPDLAAAPAAADVPGEPVAAARTEPRPQGSPPDDEAPAPLPVKGVPPADDGVAAAERSPFEDESRAPFAPPPPGPARPAPTPAEPGPRVDKKGRELPRTTFDELVSGGIGVMRGEAIPDQAPVRTRTAVEEETSTYRDATRQGPMLELDDDSEEPLVLEDHDAASSFATAGDEAWSDGPTDLEDLLIPVQVRTDPPGVSVMVDGKNLGVTPAWIDLNDGTHTVVLGGDGGSTFQVGIMANPDAWCFSPKTTGSGYRQVLCD